MLCGLQPADLEAEQLARLVRRRGEHLFMRGRTNAGKYPGLQVLLTPECPGWDPTPK